MIFENWPYVHKYWNPCFFCRRKSHSCTIQRHQAFETRWPGLLLQATFSDTVKPWGCISWPVWPLRGINMAAWGAKLIFMVDLVSPVSCANLGHLLMAQHCHLCLSACFSLPWLPTPPPPTPYRLNQWYYSHRSHWKNLKNQGHSNSWWS